MLKLININLSSQAKPAVAAQSGPAPSPVIINAASSAAITNLPIVMKSPIKLPLLKISLPTLQLLPIIELETVPTFSPPVLAEAKIQVDRPEPVAIFSQRTLDFLGAQSSTFYAAIYQAFVESRVSDAFVTALYEKALASNELFFDVQDKAAKEALDSSQSIVTTVGTVLAEIRKFDQAMFAGASDSTLPTLMLSKIGEIGPPEPLISDAPLVSTMRELVKQEYYEALDNAKLSPSSYFNGVNAPSESAVIAMNLSVAYEYFRRGTSFKFTKGGIFFDYPGKNNDEFTPEQRVFSIPLATYRDQPSLSEINKDVQKLGTPFELENEIEKNAKLGFYANQSLYKLLKPVDQLAAASTLCTLLANELCLSAGVGRIRGTPIGDEFGIAGGLAQFTKNLLGAESGDILVEGTRPAGSALDFLLINEDGSARTSTGPERTPPVLLFESTATAKIANSQSPGTTNATSAFAKTTLRSTENNKMSAYKAAITQSSGVADKALAAYKKLHNRDQTLDLLTPRGLFTRLLEEIQTSLSSTATGFEQMNQHVVAELALVAACGEKDPSYGTTIPALSRIRAMLYTQIVKIAFSLQQKRSTTVIAGKQAPDPGTSKTEVKIKRGNETEVFQVETRDLNPAPAEAADGQIDVSQIRYSADDDKNFIQPSAEPDFSLAGAIIAGTSSKIDVGDSIFGTVAFEVFTAAETRTDSLIYRLAQVFVDMCNEANATANADGGENGYISDDRLTSAHNLDGSSLCAMLFEAAARIVSVFVKAKLLKGNGANALLADGEISKAAAIEDGVANIDSEVNSAIRLIIEEVYVMSAIAPGTVKHQMKTQYNTTKTIAETGRIFVAGNFEPGGPNDVSRKALQALIDASKANSFGGVYSNGVLPAVENKQLSEIVTPHTGQRAYSFVDLRDVMLDLARERDVPYNALLAHSAKHEFTIANTASLTDLGLRLAGAAEQNEQSAALRSFAQTSLGKKYLSSATDRSLVISQQKLDRFSRQSDAPSKRLARISVGELACMRVISKELEQLSDQSVMFVNIGLPTGFAEAELLPKFKLQNGFDSPTSEATMNVTINGFDALSQDSISDVSQAFMVEDPVSQSSFDRFGNEAPPHNIQDIVDNVGLSGVYGGLTGAEFISNASDTARARELLTNEVKSYLVRKFFSVISPNDLLPETMTLTNGGQSPSDMRSSGSKTLANSLAALANLPDSVFTPAFTAKNGGEELDEQALLDLIYPRTSNTPTGQVTTPAALDFATADLFSDVFSSLPFITNQIQGRVFGVTHYEKIVCCIVTPNEFIHVGDDDKIEAGGIPVNPGSEYDTEFVNNEKTAAGVRLNTYDVNVTPGERLIQK